MEKAIAVVVILLICALGWSCFAQQTRPLPVFPQGKQSAGAHSSDRERANKLYELARQENRALQWNSCLATKASIRARRMVSERYFDHEDPKTGKNPVWNSVNLCIPANRKGSKVPAGENLAKGVDTAANIHEALMKSPTHRKNILDRRFNNIGVGCYDFICVEIFAGF
ncbi:MAG: CAP domain-containing protein [Syntrophobacteraceae bacterium]